MREKYEQLELDTRPLLTRAIVQVAKDTVYTVGEMIQENYNLMVRNGSLVPGFIRNRHEAYGVAAEWMVKITGTVKVIKKDVDSLLCTLPDQNANAVEAASAIHDSTLEGAAVLIQAAGEMKRTMDQLYKAELKPSERDPYDDMIAASGSGGNQLRPLIPRKTEE